MRLLENRKAALKNPRDGKPYDAVLISYPKSGRTWLKLQIGRAMQQHFKLQEANPLRLPEMSLLHPDVPAVCATHGIDLDAGEDPRELAQTMTQYEDTKVVFLSRDPRDVIVSCYFQLSKRRKKSWILSSLGKNKRYSGTISEFVHAPVRGGFEGLLEYYNTWAKNRHVPKDFLLVRYEDMQADPRRELLRVLNFIGLRDVSDAAVDEAIQYASFDHMRELETANTLDAHALRPRDKSDPDSYKTRRGKVGGYVDCLSPEDAEFLNRQMRQKLTDFYGYEPCVRLS